MDDRHEPDTAELCLRGGCGLIGGGTTAFFLLISKMTPFSGTFWTAVESCAVVFALLAVYFGDDAWYTLCRAVAWIWPW